MTCVSSRIALLEGEGDTENRSRGPHDCGFPRRERDCRGPADDLRRPIRSGFPGRSGAVGLYVPGAGGTVSRGASDRRAQARHGRERDFGGTPGGKILVDLSSVARAQPLRPAVYVSLPPPGEHPNTKRYDVMIVGAGYHGILTSDSTRIRGLVSIADLAPTAVALQEDGRRRSTPSPIRMPSRISARSTPGSRACTTTAAG